MADIVLRGYNGWNTRRGVEVLDQIFPKDAASQPSLIIVYFGGNDSMEPHPSGLGPHVSLPEYIENMRKIATHLQGLSDTTRIIFLGCPPVDEVRIRETRGYYHELIISFCFFFLFQAIAQSKSSDLSCTNSSISRTNELCRIYSEACVKLCNEMGIKVIDLWTAFQKQDDWLTYFIDGIHFSSSGSKIVVKEILKVLKEAEWKPSLHWKSMPTEFSEDSPYYLVYLDGKTTLNPSDWTFHREIQWD
ncbi:putative SGNH hydrolase-type esterase domain, SGNH hydrolase superfamily [Helianthus annuus]|nr:putative SGNH hydrolase-type esterase domain, SGNH hydrolase superfamily [Helianthus annuus]